MEIDRRSTQRNIVLNNWRYTQRKIEELLNTGKIFWFDDDLNVRHDVPSQTLMRDGIVFRIPVDDISEVKVVLDECGWYTTAAMRKDGELLYVTL